MRVQTLRRARRPASLLLLGSLLLSACSSLPPPAEPLPPLQGALLDRFTLQGKLGIRQAQQADSASLNWEQDRQHYRIRLSGPLGQGTIQISGEPGLVELQMAGDEQIERAPTPEALMQARLGWSLPLSQAHYWIQGRPAPDYPVAPLTNGNGFRQLGWEIEILRLTELTGPDGAPLTLPSRLRLQYDDLRLTLLIGQWLPGE